MRFADLQDGGRIYEAGETFPREGLDVSEKRLQELLGSDNRARKSLIVAIPDENGDAADQAEENTITGGNEAETAAEPHAEPDPAEKKRSRSRKKVSEDA